MERKVYKKTNKKPFRDVFYDFYEILSECAAFVHVPAESGKALESWK